jgi:hypothetical protein
MIKMSSMIHIATVHWNTAKWIDIQQYYLRKHLQSPYRIYAWLNNIPFAPLDSFYYTCSKPIISHAVKLNILADVISASSIQDDDILIFLDGDAFPIGDLESLIRQQLKVYPLMAVQRLENNGDIQPHPCFCATTVAFWRRIQGDWNAGYQWQNKDGAWVSDVGGNLLKQLRAKQVAWYPLRRSNKRNLHPIFFGVYDHVIYHHGAGFREPWTRLDSANASTTRWLQWLPLHAVVSRVPSRLRFAVVSRVPSWLRFAVLKKLYGKEITHTHLLSETVFKRIQDDPLFYEEFL